MCDEQAETVVTIGLVTDLHYAPGVVGNRYCCESLLKLRQSVVTFREQRPDVLIALGDMIDTSETVEAELVRFGELRHELERVPADVHIMRGNHDVAELTSEQHLVACGLASSYYSFDCRGVHLVILDSNFNADGSAFSQGNFSWDEAWLGRPQIEWLRDDLAASVDRPALVFCHANLDPRVRPNGMPDGHVARDADEARHVLEAAGSVRAVIQGHYHRGMQAVVNSIPYITLRAMVEGSGLEQNAYARLSLMADGTVRLEGFGQQCPYEFAKGQAS